MKKFYLILGLFCTKTMLLVAADINSEINASTGNADKAAALAQQGEARLQQATTPEDFKETAELYKNSAKLNGNNFDVQLTLGWIYMDKLHEPDSAYPHLVKAVKLRSDDVNARKLLGLSCTETGRRRQAINEFQQASILAPNDLWIRANLGRALARLGKYTEANETFNQVLASDPSNPDARLGKAELDAWQGHSEKSLEILRQLVAENPTNIEALTLMGDVHRWKWKLTQSEEDYQQALKVNPNYYDALNGLQGAKDMGASEIGVNGYRFKDTAGFLRQSAGGDGRVHITDQAYLLGGGEVWDFNQSGFTNIDRIDGTAGLEYHWARWLETTVQGDVFDYEHHSAFFGGRASAKLTPAPGFDIYANVAGRQPFVSSIATVNNNLKQDSVGNGLDLKLFGPFSFQNSLQVAKISDGNRWWEERPQLSMRILRVPETYLRAQYDYLDYQNTNALYWSPQHRHTAGPVFDTSIPLWKGCHINLNASAPYVFDQSKFGYTVRAGPSIDLFHHMEIQGSYYYSKIPGDQGAWSGKGWQASVRLSF
jgi:tetratricopeptide (TPR) repeat protein/opacity protein-like surface antigen